MKLEKDIHDEYPTIPKPSDVLGDPEKNPLGIFIHYTEEALKTEGAKAFVGDVLEFFKDFEAFGRDRYLSLGLCIETVSVNGELSANREILFQFDNDRSGGRKKSSVEGFKSMVAGNENFLSHIQMEVQRQKYSAPGGTEMYIRARYLASSHYGELDSEKRKFILEYLVILNDRAENAAKIETLQSD